LCKRRGRGTVRIGDGREPRLRMGGGVAPVNAADAAGSEYGDTDHLAPSPATRFGIDVPA
jgi:hypothetical protein